MNSSLAKLDIARKALAESKTLGDILKVRDASVAFDQYARATKMGAEALAHATEIKLLAERKAGEKLAELEKGKANQWTAASKGVEIADSPYRQTLEANSISKDQAARWQRYARLNEAAFEKATSDAKERVLRASDRGSSTTYVNQPGIDATQGNVPLAGTSHVYTVSKLLWPESVENLLSSLLVHRSVHVCCGLSKLGDLRVDSDPKHNPDVIADASDLPFKEDEFDSVLCDPPYNGRYDWNHKLLAELSRVARSRIVFQHWFIPADPNGRYRKAQEKFALSEIFVWQPKTYFGRAQLISVFDNV